MRAHGRAKVSTRNPEAFAICDNCGFMYNHSDLRWQMDWAGNKLINKRQLVCRRCNDIPQTQLRAIILPADPVPVMNPRTNNWAAAETNNRTTSSPAMTDPITGLPIPTYYNTDTSTVVKGTGLRITENDEFRVAQTTGSAPGSLNDEPGTDPNAPGDNDPGLPYGFTEVPKTGPQ